MEGGNPSADVEEGGTTNMTGAKAMRVDGVVVERAVDGVELGGVVGTEVGGGVDEVVVVVFEDVVAGIFGLVKYGRSSSSVSKCFSSDLW